MVPPEERYTRREFVSAALAAPILSAPIWSPPVRDRRTPAGPGAGGVSPSSLLEVDYRLLLARADLRYDRPPSRSEEGLPVGNGRMGSLVWTTPDTIRFQINRVDVYGNDSTTNSFYERHSDYCGGCGFVDIALGDLGPEVFPREGFSQSLSTYDGLVEMAGAGVAARVIAWPERDVMAVEISDQRASPEPIHINLRMLRFVTQYLGGELEELVEANAAAFQTRSHRADSRLRVEGERIVLTQEFREGEYLNRSAVAIGVAGRRARPKIATEQEVRLTTEPGRGSFVVLIASAASFDPGEDVVASALAALEAAAGKGFPKLAQETADWWHGYWSRGLLHLHSTDGTADHVEQHYNYFLYLMAATSRGALPPKFNGMLWNTGGDVRSWGGQHWFANLSCYYEALPASGRLELLEPMFAMYSGMLDAAATAARQQWGSEGIFIPETTYFDGLAELPEDIAAEMRDLYLLRKPWEERSAQFREFAFTGHGHSSRWSWKAQGEWVDGRWVFTDKGGGPFGHVSHILGTTAKVAYLYWRHYEYTLDPEWLRERAYPMLRGAAEFYRNFPHLRRGPDGKYHLRHVNSNESVWGASDTDEDMSALRGLLPAAIRASEILGEDAERRRAWNELLRELAPIPTSDQPGALRPADYQGPTVFSRGIRPVVRGENAFLPDRNSLPMWFFDLCHVGSADRERLQTASDTFDALMRDGIGPETDVSVLSKVAIAGVALGRSDAAKFLVPSQILSRDAEREIAYKDGGVLANRMMLREGPQALDAQRLGRAAEALQLALLQSFAPAPAGEPVLRVFPAWPADWDAAYTLLGRGGFLVTSIIRGGRIGFVELESRAGSECRLVNPWAGGAVDLYRDGHRAETLAGALLTFPTSRGERVVVVTSGDTPEAHRRTLLSA